MFDPNLSLNQSQHLFDLQLGKPSFVFLSRQCALINVVRVARHIRRSTKDDYVTHDASPVIQVEPEPRLVQQPFSTPEIYRRPDSTAPNPEPAQSGPEAIPGSRDSQVIFPDARIIEQLKTNMDQSDRRLVELADALTSGLKDVARLMIKLHNHSARVSIFVCSSTPFNLLLQGFNSGVGYAYHHIVTDDGNAPTVRLVSFV